MNSGGRSSSSHSYLDGGAQGPLDGSHSPSRVSHSVLSLSWPSRSCRQPPGTRKIPCAVKEPMSESTRLISDQQQCRGTGRHGGFDACSGETWEGFSGGKRGCKTSSSSWLMVLSFSSLYTYLHTCISMHMLPLEYQTPLAGSCREDLVASLWALNLEVPDLVKGLIP